MNLMQCGRHSDFKNHLTRTILTEKTKGQRVLPEKRRVVGAQGHYIGHREVAQIPVALN